MTTPVDETGRRVLGVLDEFIANMAKARADLAAILDAVDPPRPLTVADEDLQPERQVTVDSMEPGGWMRLTTGPHPDLWVKVAQVAETSRPDTRVVFFTGRDSVMVDAATTYPYQSAAEFDGDCQREQANATAERIDLMQQRARDFGHDDPAAA